MQDHVQRKDWNTFRRSGLLWFINSILHTFGWAIVVEVQEDGSVTDAYPARVKFRGFDEESNTDGYRKVSAYMVSEAEILLKEAGE